ncbi:type VII secretion-associated serine protease mycosin [Streptomyces rubellomurinus]|uniref:type VII secretion-associated serine protease mycosin n=1 Tax=Streptomyces rubellomurinus (strain ATCC 31215) TaxID=359131 RepID=UPI000697E4B2|nr:type VII secretion-associated serine protease mycosin [Streptomyces rubellomurinus]
MTRRRLARGTAALAAGALLWGVAAPGASADQIRDQQWALKTFEAETKVWPVSQGEGVVVAVIDSGVSPDHQDLTGQVLPGADFSGAGTDGRVDKDGHGTAMASLIAGHGHGSQAGVMGLAPKAKILPVKVKGTGDNPDPLDSDIANAIRFAVDHGAKIINMSLGGPYRYNRELRKAIAYAVSKDAVMVASSGNESASLVAYPAAFPGVVAVGAVDSTGKVWERSNSGPETTLVAPGAEIYHATAKSPTSYGVADGTSDSTAYVSATAALIRSKFPDLSAGQVINRMIKSAARPADGSVTPNDHDGYGMLSPAKALEADPAVDNGPRENPLVGRAESQGAPEEYDTPTPMAPGEDESNRIAETAGQALGVTLLVAAVVAVIGGIVVTVVLVVRARRRRQRRAAEGVPYPPHPPYGGPGPGPHQ